jgi:hypothetical protein
MFILSRIDILVNHTSVGGKDPNVHEITADISDLDFPFAFSGYNSLGQGLVSFGIDNGD